MDCIDGITDRAAADPEELRSAPFVAPAAQRTLCQLKNPSYLAICQQPLRKSWLALNHLLGVSNFLPTRKQL